MVQPHESAPSPQHDYQSQIQAILTQPLRPENIDRYADQALEQLIGVVENAEDEYVAISGAESTRDGVTQDAATQYFGLGNVNQLLDHLSDKATEIQHLDAVITHAHHSGNVLVPTDPHGSGIQPGSGEMMPAQIIPRLKTTLFILQQAFDVNLDDPESFELTEGEVLPNMMRNTSYYRLDVYALERTLLICDEEGNASFIFDTKQLADLGYNGQDIHKMTKSDLDLMIDTHPSVGRSMRYSENFVSKMVASIENPGRDAIGQDVEQRRQKLSLVPKPPEMVLSRAGISEAFDVGKTALKALIDELGSDLDSTNYYRFGTGKPVPGYDPWEQNKIWDALAGKRSLVPEAPEGYVSVNGLAKRLGISNNVVDRVVQQYPEEVGNIGRFRPRIVDGKRDSGAPFNGLSMEQQSIIEQKLQDEGSLLPPAPEGFLSSKAISRQLQVSQGAVARAIEELNLTSSGIRAKVRATPAIVYGVEDQQKIAEYLKDNDLFAEVAPDDYRSVSGIAKSYGISDVSVNAAIDELGESLGVIEKRIMGVRSRNAFSPNQQEMISQWLEESGRLTPRPPEDVLSFEQLFKELHVAPKTLKAVIEELDTDGLLGDRGLYKYGSVKAEGFTPGQKAMLKARLDARRKQ